MAVPMTSWMSDPMMASSIMAYSAREMGRG